MTAPAALPAPTPPAEDQPDLSAAEAALIAAVAAWLASLPAAPLLAGAAVAALLPAWILDGLAELGIPPVAGRAAAALVRTAPLPNPPAPTVSSPRTAARRIAEQEPSRRAAYLLAAARRIAESLRTPTVPASTEPRSRTERVRDALDVERRYWRQHLQAGQHRAQAAAQVDEAAQHSLTGLLRWRTQGDSRVTPDCRALNRSIFTVDNPPGGLLPGTAHGQCRCYAEPA